MDAQSTFRRRRGFLLVLAEHPSWSEGPCGATPRDVLVITPGDVLAVAEEAKEHCRRWLLLSRHCGVSAV